MLLFDCLPKRWRQSLNASKFRCLRRGTEYRLFEEGLRKYEDEINIVRLIRDQRWMLAAVKKLMSEKSAETRREVHKQAQKQKFVKLAPQASMSVELAAKEMEDLLRDEILDNEEESSLDISDDEESEDESEIASPISIVPNGSQMNHRQGLAILPLTPLTKSSDSGQMPRKQSSAGTPMPRRSVTWKDEVKNELKNKVKPKIIQS